MIIDRQSLTAFLTSDCYLFHVILLPTCVEFEHTRQDEPEKGME